MVQDKPQTKHTTTALSSMRHTTQWKEALAFKQEEANRLFDAIMRSHDDPVIYLQKLFFGLYEASLEGRAISIGTASAAIPVSHSETSRKYLDWAIEQGFITTERDTRDRRKWFVKPTDKMFELVEAEVKKVSGKHSR